MVGYAVSGFVDGFFKGRDWRDAKEDRKLDRERQKRLDELQLREFGLREQDFAMRKRAADLQYSEAEREIARRAEEQAFLEQMAASAPGAGGGMGVLPAGGGIDTSAYPVGVPQGQPMSSPMAPAAPARPAAPAAPRLGFGVTTTAPSPAMPPQANNLPPEGLPITNVQPVQGTLPQPPASPAAGIPPLLAQNPDGTISAARPPRSAEEKAALVEAAKTGKLTMQPANVIPQMGIDAKGLQGGPVVPINTPTEVNPQSSALVQKWQGASRSFEINQNSDRIARGLGNGADGGPASSVPARFLADIGNFIMKTPEAGKAYNATADDRARAQKWYGSSEAEALFQANPELQSAAAADPYGFYKQAQANGVGRAAMEAAANPPSEAKQNVAAAETAATASPAAAAGAETTKQVAQQVNLSFGLKPGETLTPKQVKSAADATVDWYYENALPKMVEFYVGRGEMEKAQALVDLTESRQGKLALQDRSAGLFKIINGDIDGGFDLMLSSFKRYGYVDESYQLDEDETGIMRDAEGGFAGLRMVFKDSKTGDTMEQVFGSLDEAISYGMQMTDPNTMIEMLAAQKAAPQGALTDVQKRILDDANTIMEQNEARALQGLPPITQEQAFEMAAANVAAVTGQSRPALGSLGASTGATDPRLTGVDPNTGLYREQ